MNIDELREQLEHLAGPNAAVTADAREAVSKRVRTFRRRRGAITALAVVLVAAIVSVGVRAAQNQPLKVRTVSSTTATATTPARDPQCLPGISTVSPNDVPADVKAWAHGAPVVGAGELWTIRSAIAVAPDHQGKIWFLKFPWFTRPFGLPKINGRRLDGAGTFRADANQAIDQRGEWVVSGLKFSTPGCWEVTARYDRATITFRTLVGGTKQSTTGTITGTLEMVGGPAPGSARAVAGSIHVTGVAGTYPVATDQHGHFRVELPPGAYTVTGTSRSIDAGRDECVVGGPVVVARARTTTAQVICSVP